MSERQIALKVMEHRGLRIDDRGFYGVMRNQVEARLRGLVKRGTLEQTEAASCGVRWELAGLSPCSLPRAGWRMTSRIDLYLDPVPRVRD